MWLKPLLSILFIRRLKPTAKAAKADGKDQPKPKANIANADGKI